MAARMVAMKSASDNAGKLIDELHSFTTSPSGGDHKSFSEIVGGAAAVYSVSTG